MESAQFDLAIIGGGPAGYTAAERASENGLQTVLFEKNAMGGVCLNEGCIPTKTLLFSAKTLDHIKTASKYGINPGGDATFDYGKMMDRKEKVVRRLVSGVRMRLEASGVKMVEGTAKITDNNEDNITIECDGKQFQVSYLIICTGTEVFIPPITGLDKIDYWTSREALRSKDIPQKLTIIGGGVIGMEFASLFNSLGVKVTIIEMLPEILGNMDKDLSGLIRKEYTKRGIEFHLSAKVTGVTEGKIKIEKENKEQELESGKVMVCVGRSPVTKDLGLDKLGIEPGKKGIKTNEFMQTSHPHVYACGDINGVSLFAHTAYREAEVAIHHIIGKEDKMDYDSIPVVVYTSPEVASVGKTEDELKQQAIRYRVLSIPMTYSGRFMAENEGFQGLCKLLTGEDEHIIGFHFAGNPASEFIAAAGIAIANNYTVEEFRKYIFPHPTVSEVIHESLYL